MALLHCIADGIKVELRPGDVSPGFRERCDYFFSSPVDGATLYIDEAPAEVLRKDGQKGWGWQPGFYAGQVVVELVSDKGQPLAKYMLDVAPDDSKLGNDIFGRMLGELFECNPALVFGAEAAQTEIGVSGSALSTLLEYARLRRYSEAFLSALKAVTERPLTRLRRERALVPYHQVKRLDVASVRGMLRRPGNAVLLLAGGAPDNGEVPQFDVTRSTDDLDNPANRALTAKLLGVRRRCVRVAQALDRIAADEKDSSTRTPLRPRLSRKLEFLNDVAGRLAKLHRVEPFASVSRPEVTVAGLNAISAHPGYARAYRYAWAALRPGVEGESGDEMLWLSPTWEIYERWCFTRVEACLREMYADLSWKVTLAHDRDDHIRLVGTSQDIRIEAALQRSFSSEGANKAGFRSVSMQLKPDIVITLESGGERRMLTLDAKYRTSRANVLDAMRSAHIYQDALRWNGERPKCSLLLVPKGGGAPWLEDPSFQAGHRVGVHVLAPDAPSADLMNVLQAWLRSPSPTN